MRFAILGIAMLALVVVTASAQPIISAKSGVIAGLEGKVFLDNQALESSVTHFPDMKENSVLRTEDGRAEILLPPGYVLRIGENASFKMLTNRLIDTRVEIMTADRHPAFTLSMVARSLKILCRSPTGHTSGFPGSDRRTRAGSVTIVFSFCRTTGSGSVNITVFPYDFDILRPSVPGNFAAGVSSAAGSGKTSPDLP